jgi:ribulose-5-phosphate 4-epimerase/fuculose-1-phosphate aldolase
MNESELRERLVVHGRSLYGRGYAAGSAGNISVRVDDGILVTPTGSCLGHLEPGRISKVSMDGVLVSGDKPTKEVYLHLAVYEERPDAAAVVHLHSAHAVAVSCLTDVDPEDVLPPLTPYYVMRVGTLPLVRYHRPGSDGLAVDVRARAKGHSAVLLAHHGPAVWNRSLDAAVYAAEELEEAAKVYLLVRNRGYRVLDAAQRAELRK